VQPAEQQYLAEVLVRRGVVAADKVEEILATARERNQSFADALASSNVVEE
jgi:general secretion pathway protein E